MKERDKERMEGKEMEMKEVRNKELKTDTEIKSEIK